MSGIANSSWALEALTLPPYRILTDPPIVASSAATLARIIACTSWACSPEAVRPVPIAHTGSYAITALARDFTPLTDMRASADYRRLVARNLLEKFRIETTEPETAVNLLAEVE